MEIIVKHPNAELTLHILDSENPISIHDLLASLERQTIAQMLAAHGGVKARAAISLGLNRTTLVEKARKYGFPLNK